MPADSGNAARSAWRTIETGIRAAQVWPDLWYRFLLSPAMTDDALLVFLRAYADHARHLMAFHTTGNWLAMEGNGLFHVGVLFPEFKDAKAWRDTAAGWIYAELNNQVYPDGVQIELSSGYHHVSQSNFLALYRIARLNDTPLPGDYLARLEKMYDFDVYGAMPDRRLPGVQDGNYYDVHRTLTEAAELFPARQDFRWYATDGTQGQPPHETSHAFPYAGYYVMRSGWDPEARWLLFDGGPFGYGHQHEDKLEIIVAALRQESPGRSRQLHLRALEVAFLFHRFPEPQRRPGRWPAAAPPRPPARDVRGQGAAPARVVERRQIRLRRGHLRRGLRRHRQTQRQPHALRPFRKARLLGGAGHASTPRTLGSTPTTRSSISIPKSKPTACAW